MPNQQTSQAPAHGLFVGLLTVDLAYVIDQPLVQNEKYQALQQTLTTGGPATNAAKTAAALNYPATLITAVGHSPFDSLIQQELSEANVSVIDQATGNDYQPPISSILIDQKTGDRTVVSTNAANTDSQISLDHAIGDASFVLLDGHLPKLALSLAKQARAKGIPVILDGGSWKPGTETLLPWIDFAICSARFNPPNTSSPEEVIQFLTQQNIERIAITRGSHSVIAVESGVQTEIQPPPVDALDTLGAGDIFHGAFCQAIGCNKLFVTSLRSATELAAESCRLFGMQAKLNFLRQSAPSNAS